MVLPGPAIVDARADPKAVDRLAQGRPDASALPRSVHCARGGDVNASGPSALGPSFLKRGVRSARRVAGRPSPIGSATDPAIRAALDARVGKRGGNDLDGAALRSPPTRPCRPHCSNGPGRRSRLCAPVQAAPPMRGSMRRARPPRLLSTPIGFVIGPPRASPISAARIPQPNWTPSTTTFTFPAAAGSIPALNAGGRSGFAGVGRFGGAFAPWLADTLQSPEPQPRARLAKLTRKALVSRERAVLPQPRMPETAGQARRRRLIRASAVKRPCAGTADVRGALRPCELPSP